MDETEDVFCSAEIIIHDLIEELVLKGAESLYEKYLDEKSAGFSARATISTIYSTLELFYFRREPGEPKVWQEDPEPNSSSADTWMRNAVPIKKVVPLQKIPETTVTLPDAKSVASHSTRRTNQQRMGRSSRRANMREADTIDEPIQAIPIEGLIIETDEEVENLRSFKARQAKRKKEEIERLKSIKEEEEAKEKKIQKDSETIKNKIFTYDYKGKIVLIAPPKAENFPALNQTVRYTLPEPIIEDVKPVKKKKLEILPVKRNKTAPQSEQEWVKNLTVGQQVMFDQIKLSPGVALMVLGRSTVLMKVMNLKP
jgi:hypothetical protein